PLAPPPTPWPPLAPCPWTRSAPSPGPSRVEPRRTGYSTSIGRQPRMTHQPNRRDLGAARRPRAAAGRENALKFLRIGAPGAERPAVLSADGTPLDLSGITADIDGSFLSGDGPERV